MGGGGQGGWKDRLSWNRGGGLPSLTGGKTVGPVIPETLQDNIASYGMSFYIFIHNVSIICFFL